MSAHCYDKRTFKGLGNAYSLIHLQNNDEIYSNSRAKRALLSIALGEFRNLRRQQVDAGFTCQ